MQSPLFRKAMAALLSATLLIGIAFGALTPPFEGFDENAHYSRLISTAYCAQTPAAKPNRLTREMDDYQKIAPMPESWLQIPIALSEASSHTTPDYDIFLEPTNGTADSRQSAYRQSYQGFFSDPLRVAKFVKAYRDEAAETDYTPGREPNWEYQHPPAYYYLFTPMVRLLDDEPLVDKLILLRITNYMLVMIGGIIALRATYVFMSAEDNATAQEIMLFGMLFPFLAPCFWGEFVRLGNDNLCVFLFAIAWSLLLKHLRHPEARSLWIGLGVVLGLGWLVKFTMVMVSCGVILFLLVHHLVDGKKQVLAISRRIFPVAVTAIICGLIGGSWYIYGHLSGEAQGALEITWMLHDKDLLKSFLHNMSLQSFFDGVRVMLASGVFVYNSLSRITAEYLSWVLYVIVAAIVFAYSRALKKTGGDDLHGLPLYVIVPPLLMLLVHIAYSITELGYFITSGRYLLVVLPAFYLITGIGIRSFAHAKEDLRIIAFGTYLVAPIASLYLFWRSLAVFGACAVEQNPPSGEFVWTPPYCLDQIAPIFSHLKVLGWPVFGASCFLTGWLLLLYGVFVLFRVGATTKKT